MKHFREKDEIERFFESRYIKLEDVRDYFRERGNFVFSATTSNFNSHISNFILANTSLTDLRKFIKKDVYVTCNGFILETNLDKEELVDYLKDARGEEHHEDELQQIDECYTTEDEEVIQGNASYLKSQTSDVNIFDSQETSVEFRIREIDGNDGQNSFLVTCFPEYKKDIDLLRKLVAWILRRDDEAEFNIQNIGFSNLQDVEAKHNAISEVLSDVDDYEIIGVSGVEAHQIEDHSSDESSSEVLAEDFQKIGGETKMISTDELLDFLRENSKTCDELTVAYWSGDNDRGSLIEIKDQRDLVVKLKDIRHIQNHETIATIDDYEDEDRVISNLEESKRKNILESYFQKISEKIYNNHL